MMMMDKQTICAVATADGIKQAMAAFGVPESAPMITALRNAWCGDAEAAATVERVASAAPSCGCKGNAVKTLKEHVFGGSPARGAPFAALSRVIPGGQSGLGQTMRPVPAHKSLDYNCRRDNGRLTDCEATILSEEGTVDVSFGTALGSPAELREVAAIDLPLWNLPPPPAGLAWYLALQAPELVSGDKISQELCLNAWTITSNLAVTPIVPVRVQQATERLTLGNGGGQTIQALTGWNIIPRTGYEITDGRCRCVSIQCLKITWTGRSVVAFLARTRAIGESWTASIEWLRTAIQIEAGPCPPDLYCAPRPILGPPCQCSSFPTLVIPQAPPDPGEPDPGGAPPAPLFEERRFSGSGVLREDDFAAVLDLMSRVLRERDNDRDSERDRNNERDSERDRDSEREESGDA